MKSYFINENIEITDEKLSLFDTYYNLLITYNQKFNITAITDKKEVYIKHFIDSLKFASTLTTGKLIDVGSGGGFPALPIKIVNENLDVTLLEATKKKCDFLDEVINKLGLKGVKVINSRAEDIAFDSNFRESFDYCTARAVARLNVLTEYCLPFVKKGGLFVAYKGDADEEINEACNAINTLGGKIKDIKKYELDGAKRTLVYIEKVKNTDKKYPRTNGKIRKSPL